MKVSMDENEESEKNYSLKSPYKPLYVSYKGYYGDS